MISSASFISPIDSARNLSYSRSYPQFSTTRAWRKYWFTAVSSFVRTWFSRSTMAGSPFMRTSGDGSLALRATKGERPPSLRGCRSRGVAPDVPRRAGAAAAGRPGARRLRPHDLLDLAAAATAVRPGAGRARDVVRRPGARLDLGADLGLREVAADADDHGWAPGAASLALACRYSRTRARSSSESFALAAIFGRIAPHAARSRLDGA